MSRAVKRQNSWANSDRRRANAISAAGRLRSIDERGRSTVGWFLRRVVERYVVCRTSLFTWNEKFPISNSPRRLTNGMTGVVGTVVYGVSSRSTLSTSTSWSRSLASSMRSTCRHRRSISILRPSNPPLAFMSSRQFRCRAARPCCRLRDRRSAASTCRSCSAALRQRAGPLPNHRDGHRATEKCPAFHGFPSSLVVVRASAAPASLLVAAIGRCRTRTIGSCWHG